MKNQGLDNFTRSLSDKKKKRKPQTVNNLKKPALAGSGSTVQANPLTLTESDAAGSFIHGVLFFKIYQKKKLTPQTANNLKNPALAGPGSTS